MASECPGHARGLRVDDLAARSIPDTTSIRTLTGAERREARADDALARLGGVSTVVTENPLGLSDAGLRVIRARFGCSRSEAPLMLLRHAGRTERSLLEVTRDLLDDHRRGCVLADICDE